MAPTVPESPGQSQSLRDSPGFLAVVPVLEGTTANVLLVQDEIQTLS